MLSDFGTMQRIGGKKFKIGGINKKENGVAKEKAKVRVERMEKAKVEKVEKVKEKVRINQKVVLPINLKPMAISKLCRLY